MFLIFAERKNKKSSPRLPLRDGMVREKGLEPLHLGRKNLNLVRLPISPLPQSGTESIELGWLMGLEPTTTGITIRDSTN